MEDNRKEQVEALEALKDYNPKICKALAEIVPELKGEKKEDTQEYVDHIFRGINWELQVINGTLTLLNEKEEQVSKDALNEMISHINDAYVSKLDEKLAGVIEEELLPFAEKLEGYIEKALA
ncbi:MAG: molecular chaperone [Lachnospiraceae bacterium]|nr:molecular chaperone [Lachnospiraceae bacterium]